MIIFFNTENSREDIVQLDGVIIVAHSIYSFILLLAALCLNTLWRYQNYYYIFVV